MLHNLSHAQPYVKSKDLTPSLAPSKRFQTKSYQVLSLSLEKGGFVEDVFRWNQVFNKIKKLQLTLRCKSSSRTGARRAAKTRQKIQQEVTVKPSLFNNQFLL